MPSEPWTRPGIRRIVLVGFMAAGKTTVGRLLADRLGWRHVDFDARILERTGRSSGAIIRADGEAAFRAEEAALTRELAGSTRVVLSPGGGWGADPARLSSLGDGTVGVWLRITPEEAVRRARADGTDRPLLGTGDEAAEDAAGRASELLARREAGYRAAPIAIDVDGKGPAAVAEEIVRRLETHSGG